MRAQREAWQAEEVRTPVEGLARAILQEQPEQGVASEVNQSGEVAAAKPCIPAAAVKYAPARGLEAGAVQAVAACKIRAEQ